jgi:hypothetical protein
MIKETTISLNTGELKRATAFTPLINGTLRAIILKANGIDLRISLERFPAITLFNRLNVNSLDWEYLPLAIQLDTGENAEEKWTFNAREWALNDKLRIEIAGGSNLSAEIIFRWSE